MSEPGEYWTIERGRGWTRISRDPERPYVMVLTDTAACHIHYWTDDAEMDAQGYGCADLVCHGCGRATRVLFPPVGDAEAGDEPLRPLRDAFTAQHRDCVHRGNEALCPPKYEIAETMDLRP